MSASWTSSEAPPAAALGIRAMKAAAATSAPSARARWMAASQRVTSPARSSASPSSSAARSSAITISPRLPWTTSSQLRPSIAASGSLTSTHLPSR